MQVTSTLWPDIKSQKLLEHRFRLRWTKSDAITQFRQAKTNMDQTRRPRTACPNKMGAVGGPGRPTNLPGQPTWPVGSTALAKPHGVSWLVH